jgi:hypothetical protein
MMTEFVSRWSRGVGLLLRLSLMGVIAMIPGYLLLGLGLGLSALSGVTAFEDYIWPLVIFYCLFLLPAVFDWAAQIIGFPLESKRRPPEAHT